jgi:hypothetical protein
MIAKRNTFAHCRNRILAVEPVASHYSGSAILTYPRTGFRAVQFQIHCCGLQCMVYLLIYVLYLNILSRRLIGRWFDSLMIFRKYVYTHLNASKQLSS